MNRFALLPAADRAVILQETAARMGVGSAAIVEKDVWVCWTPGQIFTATSLSEGYGIIAPFLGTSTWFSTGTQLALRARTIQAISAGRTGANAGWRNSRPPTELSKAPSATYCRNDSRKN